MAGHIQHQNGPRVPAGTVLNIKTSWVNETAQYMHILKGFRCQNFPGETRNLGSKRHAIMEHARTEMCGDTT